MLNTLVIESVVPTIPSALRKIRNLFVIINSEIVQISTSVALKTRAPVLKISDLGCLRGLAVRQNISNIPFWKNPFEISRIVQTDVFLSATIDLMLP